eukprot:459988-Pyramimonas_sp.AAC.1
MREQSAKRAETIQTEPVLGSGAGVGVEEVGKENDEDLQEVGQHLPHQGEAEDPGRGEEDEVRNVDIGWHGLAPPAVVLPLHFHERVAEGAVWVAVAVLLEASVQVPVEVFVYCRGWRRWWCVVVVAKLAGCWTGRSRLPCCPESQGLNAILKTTSPKGRAPAGEKDSVPIVPVCELADQVVYVTYREDAFHGETETVVYFVGVLNDMYAERKYQQQNPLHTVDPQARNVGGDKEGPVDGD